MNRSIIRPLSTGLFFAAAALVSLSIFASSASAEEESRNILCVKKIGKTNVKGRDAYLAATQCRAGYFAAPISSLAPKGDVGAKGEKGDKGDKGDAGEGLQVGTITGSVEGCQFQSFGTLTIFVPGRAFTAKLLPTGGQFTFDNVPPGVYSIYIENFGQTGEVASNVTVNAGEVTSLEALPAFCGQG